MILEFNHYLLLLSKFIFVLGSILYLIFALIIVKQVTMMSKNVNDKFNWVLIAFSYFHLAFSVLLVLLTLIAL